MADTDLALRVEREKASNEGDDIIGRAHALKDRFSHVWQTTERVRRDEWQILNDVSGKRVLDYGCGKGDYAVRLLAMGAYVEGIDIARTYIDECSQVAREGGYDPSRYRFQVMDAHRLEFPDDHFDIVVGNGILHHLDFELALSEIRRVLKPGGRAIFQEPVAGNPLLRLFRLLTPSARTEDERPFTRADLRRMERGWVVENRYYGLIATPVAMATSILLRPWPDNPVLRLATAIERRMSRWTWLGTWHQYVLFNLVKPPREGARSRPASG